MGSVLSADAPEDGGRKTKRSYTRTASACAVGAVLFVAGLVAGCLWGPGAVRSVSPTLARDLGFSEVAGTVDSNLEDGYGGALARRVAAASSDVCANALEAPALDDATAPVLDGLARAAGGGAAVDDAQLGNLIGLFGLRDSFSRDGGRSPELVIDWARLENPDTGPARLPGIESRRVFGVAIVRVGNLCGGASENLRRALVELGDSTVSCVVLDLRDCWAGTVEEAASAASLFLDGGTAFELRRANGEVRVHADPDACECRIPVAVLVSGRTAGAAEAFASALQAHGRARIMGGPTRGEGRVQVVRTLSFGGAIRYTVAEIATADGEEISGTGIVGDARVFDAASRLGIAGLLFDRFPFADAEGV